ncbi:nuclear transport factor 2 family protein [Shewanella halifaxensis]|uniref:nuclear transport factor 2 family protein n=1 Tax=Shewanella halifaxensis TaxID=271098 RepID=UPI000D59CF77|nr:nuclear transport factor 2 family protein [Shewanella halifaxensis]
MKLAKFISIVFVFFTCSNAAAITRPIAYQAPVIAESVEQHPLIDAHLRAYNSNKFDDFKALFHPEVEAYEFPDKLLFKGMAGFDKTYEYLVSSIYKSAFISKRIVDRDFVIDRETVTTDALENDMELVVIYQIKDNLIYRMMFLKQ